MINKYQTIDDLWARMPDRIRLILSGPELGSPALVFRAFEIARGLSVVNRAFCQVARSIHIFIHTNRDLLERAVMAQIGSAGSLEKCYFWDFLCRWFGDKYVELFPKEFEAYSPEIRLSLLNVFDSVVIEDWRQFVFSLCRDGNNDIKNSALRNLALFDPLVALPFFEEVISKKDLSDVEQKGLSIGLRRLQYEFFPNSENKIGDLPLLQLAATIREWFETIRKDRQCFLPYLYSKNLDLESFVMTLGQLNIVEPIIHGGQMGQMGEEFLEKYLNGRFRLINNSKTTNSIRAQKLIAVSDFHFFSNSAGIVNRVFAGVYSTLPMVRLRCAEYLMLNYGHDSWTLVNHLFFDRDQAVRKGLCEILEEVPVQMALDALVSVCFDDPSTQVRCSAISALRSFEVHVVSKVLLDLLDSKNCDSEIQNAILLTTKEFSRNGSFDVSLEESQGEFDEELAKAFLKSVAISS